MSSKKRKHKNGWMVFKTTATNNKTGVDITFVNVAPCYGSDHKGTPDCWCEPEVKENGILLIHKSDN
jgi:hypothetical protein